MMDKNQKQERLREAFQDAKRGMAVRKAARLYGVPPSTLRDRLADPNGLDAKKGAPTIFSRVQEEELAKHCIGMTNLGYGFTRWQILDLASNMCQSLRVDRTPTKHWFYGFMSRFPELTMIKPKKREKARDDAVTEEVIVNYFASLEELMETYDMTNRPAHVWNIDESGISLDHNPPKVLAVKGSNPHAVTHGHSVNTTIIAAVSALGETIPPFIIYKGERLSKELTSGGLNSTEYRTSSTGWSNSVLFLEFFKNHFHRHVAIRPCLVLYDGHSTHVTSDIIATARAEGVHLFVLPPHSSHYLQPLDVSVFSPFKRSLNTEFHRYLHSHPNHLITRELLPGMISTAYRTSLTVSTIMAGFRKTGVFPLDPSAVKKEAPTITKKTEGKKVVSRKERNNNRTVKILFEEKAKTFKDLKEAVEPLTKKPRKRFIPPYGAAITEDNFLAEKETENMAPKPAKLPENRKLKSKSKAFKSPFKDNLSTEDTDQPPLKKVHHEQDVEKPKGGKGPKPGSKKGKGLQKKKSQPTVVIEEEDDELCLVCGRWQPEKLDLHVSIKFVEWFQCVRCSRWVHKKYCTDFIPATDEDEYICPKCTSED